MSSEQVSLEFDQARHVLDPGSLDLGARGGVSRARQEIQQALGAAQQLPQALLAPLRARRVGAAQATQALHLVREPVRNQG